MPTEILRPNGTVFIDGSVTGAASAHAATNDNSDATYVSPSTASLFVTGGVIAAIQLDLTSFTLGTGRTKTVRCRVRGRSNSGSSVWMGAKPSYLVTGVADAGDLVGTTAITVNGAAVAATLDQAALDALKIDLSYTSEASGVRYLEAYLDVVYATVPVVAITSPTGAPSITATNAPTITWSYTQGTDGGPQTRYEVKVFTAAQIAAGGFSPDTTVGVFESGTVLSAATNHTVGALANSTTYGVYVRAAQTINGQPHWSAWNSQTFSINVTTSDVTVAAVPNNSTASVAVTVTRVGASAAWNAVEVQRSIDGGTTWVPVRYADYVNTTDANTFVVTDHEAGNGQNVRYRARATRFLSGLPITGAWVLTAAVVQWTSASAWLKDPADPSVNLAIKLANLGNPARTVRQGVHQVLGRTDPIIVSDVRSTQQGELSIRALTIDESNAISTLLDRNVVRLDLPASWDEVPSRYLVPGQTTTMRLSPKVAVTARAINVQYWQTRAPSDPLSRSATA